jgi:hypothetical protein
MATRMYAIASHSDTPEPVLGRELSSTVVSAELSVLLLAEVSVDVGAPPVSSVVALPVDTSGSKGSRC